jgi:hypothetical protein
VAIEQVDRTVVTTDPTPAAGQQTMRTDSRRTSTGPRVAIWTIGILRREPASV